MSMTESEALKILKRDLQIQKDNKALPDGIESLEIAIKSLEEVEQYRAIGTVEELQKMKDDYAEAITDWRQYKKIGTIERFRELTEKAEPKKPYIQQVEIDFYEHDCMECPGCDSFLGYASDCKDEHYQDNYCPHCGQRLDWE